MKSRSFYLTPAMSKRLIAKGILVSEPIQKAMRDGTIYLCYGTTNGYIAQELLGEKFDKTRYVAGITSGFGLNNPKPEKKEPALVIRKGVIEREVDIIACFTDLSPSDVVLKGANAIGKDGKAGVLIGHPTGGTMGALAGPLVAGRATLIHPVGIEKSIPISIVDASLLTPGLPAHQGPTLFLSPGAVFTECDALKALFADAEVYPFSAGGIGGAEGAVWLFFKAGEESFVAFNELYAQLKKEPPFI